MTRFDPNADPETRRAEAEFAVRRRFFDPGCASGCGGWLLGLVAVAACVLVVRR